MKQDLITLIGRYLATFSTWLAIAMLVLYLGYKIMPHLGFSGSLKMAFHTALADQAVSGFDNAFHLSISLDYKK